MESTDHHMNEEIHTLGFMSAGCLVLLPVFEPARLLANQSYPIQASGMGSDSQYSKTSGWTCCEADVYWNACATKRCVAISYFSCVRLLFDWAGFRYCASCPTAMSLSSSSEQKGAP
jgi:hypothetical protein